MHNRTKSNIKSLNLIVSDFMTEGNVKYLDFFSTCVNDNQKKKKLNCVPTR